MKSEFTGIIRVYNYSDFSGSCGDLGTVAYVKVKKEYFDIYEPFPSFNVNNNNISVEKFYSYKLNNIGEKFLKEKVQYHHIPHDWDFVTEKDINDELLEVKAKLKIYETIIE